MCPRDKPLDLATFHQNRAAAYDQMEETDKVIIEYSIVEQKILIIVQVLSDCDTAINLNNKYVKALDRRAKTLRKQAMKVVMMNIKRSDVETYCLFTGVICLYRYFEIFLLVLIPFPTAKSFLQRIFTPKKIFGTSGQKITYKSYISS